MSEKIEVQPETSRDLVICRIMNAPAEKLYKAWTTPESFKEWFCPKPWTVTDVKIDLHPGGTNSMTMKGPEGQQFPNIGTYLEIVPNRKLVFTDAYVGDWKPSQKPFMTAIVTFEDLGNGKTRYTAIARHWTETDREAHEKMGFHTGWAIVADQLEAFASKL